MEAEARLDLLDRVRPVRAPAAPTSIRTRLLSARDSRPVSTSIPRSPSGSATDQAASAVQPLAKTASRANSRRSSGAQQLVAPGDRPAQRALSLGQVARAAGEVEAPAEPLEDRRRAHDPDAGRRELEREREPVEAFADRPDRRPSRPRRRRGPGGASGRDPRTGRCPPSTSSGGIGCPRSPGDPQQLPARHEQAQVRCSADEPGHDVGAGRQELLEVVEQRGARFGRAGARGGPRRWRGPATRARPSVAAIAASRSDGSRSAARSTNQTPCG